MACDGVVVLAHSQKVFDGAQPLQGLLLSAVWVAISAYA